MQLYGFCLSLGRGENSVVAVVTELGEPLSQLALLQLSWERRLRLALDAAELLAYMAVSPLGPVALADLRLEQFLVSGGRLKLTDLDDLQLGEPRCAGPDACLLPPPAAASPVLSRCTAGRCQVSLAGREEGPGRQTGRHKMPCLFEQFAGTDSAMERLGAVHVDLYWAHFASVCSPHKRGKLLRSSSGILAADI